MLDNLKIHKITLIQDWLVQYPRFHLHFTPTNASWLSLIECWFSLLHRRRLECKTFISTTDLKAATQSYIAQTNAHPKPFAWTMSSDQILANLARFCKLTSHSNH